MTAAGCVMCERIGAAGDLFISDLTVSRAYLIHWHLIPRLAADPDAGGSVSRVSYEAVRLPPPDVTARVADIRRALEERA